MKKRGGGHMHPRGCACGRCVWSNPEARAARIAQYNATGKPIPGWYPSEADVQRVADSLKHAATATEQVADAVGSTEAAVRAAMSPPAPAGAPPAGAPARKAYPMPSAAPPPPAAPLAKVAVSEVIEGSGFWTQLGDTLNTYGLDKPDVKFKIKVGPQTDSKFDNLLAKAYPGAILDPRIAFWSAVALHFGWPLGAYWIPKLLREKGKGLLGSLKGLFKFGKKKKKEGDPPSFERNI